MREALLERQRLGRDVLVVVREDEAAAVRVGGDPRAGRRTRSCRPRRRARRRTTRVVLPGAMWSAPLWPTRRTVTSGMPGTSRSCGCPPTWPRDRIGAPGRSAGTAARPCRRCGGSGSGCRRAPTAACAGGTRATIASASSSRTAPVGRQGSMRASKQPSTFHRLPIPAIVRWSSSASPIGRVGSSSRSRRRKRAASNSGARMSGPSWASCWSMRVRELGHQLQHRALELRPPRARRAAARARRRAPAPRAAVEHAPRARHAQVRVDRELALEAQEQVLAVRVDRSSRRGRPGARASRARPKRGCGVAISSGTWPARTGRMRFAA